MLALVHGQIDEELEFSQKIFQLGHIGAEAAKNEPFVDGYFANGDQVV